MEIKQAIQIGDNVTDIMKVSMVMRCQKEPTVDGYELVYYVLVPSGALAPARKGDWLVEHGKWWVVFKDAQYRRYLKNICSNAERSTV